MGRGVEAEIFFVEEKHAHVFPCVVAGCCSNWCFPHIYGWVLVSVFSKFFFLNSCILWEDFAISHEHLQNKIFSFFS